MSNDLPEAVLATLYGLWRMNVPLPLTLLPRDAWIVLGVVQYAARNPQLSDREREVVTAVGRALQRQIAQLDPRLDEYMEQGWDPAFDQPRATREEGQ